MNDAMLTAAPQAARTKPYVCTLLIPTKNAGELFKRVLAGLQSQTCWADVEFLVVDSGSTDDTIALAKAAGARVTQIPPAEFNHGATRDFGISMASTNRIILTVQDAVPRDAVVIENLLKALDEDGVAGVYAHQIAQPDADVITTRNLERHYTGRSERVVQQIQGVAHYLSLHPSLRHALCNFDNVCSALRKDVWEQEKFGRVNFGEDIDWAERVLKRGYKIIYEPKAGVIHSHDRPISYEYKRTYVCHRKLYSLFGLELLPTPRTAVIAYLHWTLRDAWCIFKRERRPWEFISGLFKAPILNFFRIYGIYQAEQDEKLGVQKSVSGV